MHAHGGDSPGDCWYAWRSPFPFVRLSVRPTDPTDRQRARTRNVVLPRNLEELRKLRAVSEVRSWSCGYEDQALDVAVHVRRGDL